MGSIDTMPRVDGPEGEQLALEYDDPRFQEILAFLGGFANIEQHAEELPYIIE